MAIETYDPTLDPDNACDCEENECNNDGCRKLFAIGPCSTIINAVNPVDNTATIGGYVRPEDMIFDVNVWCQVNQANSVQINPNKQIREKGYLHSCLPNTKPGRSRPTISVDVDFCRTDDGHCLLQRAGDDCCLVGFMCMYDRAEFQPNISPVALPDIVYGIARVEEPSQNFVFDQDDNRVYTLRIHKYMWKFNSCMSAANLLKMNSEFKGTKAREVVGNGKNAAMATKETEAA